MWVEFEERIPSFPETTTRYDTLLEQTNITKDKSDYLWYTSSYDQYESSNRQAVLKVNSAGHVLRAFVNGVLVGMSQNILASLILLLSIWFVL